MDSNDTPTSDISNAFSRLQPPKPEWSIFILFLNGELSKDLT